MASKASAGKQQKGQEKEEVPLDPHHLKRCRPSPPPPPSASKTSTKKVEGGYKRSSAPTTKTTTTLPPPPSADEFSLAEKKFRAEGDGDCAMEAEEVEDRAARVERELATKGEGLSGAALREFLQREFLDAADSDYNAVDMLAGAYSL